MNIKLNKVNVEHGFIIGYDSFKTKNYISIDKIINIRVHKEKDVDCYIYLENLEHPFAIDKNIFSKVMYKVHAWKLEKKTIFGDIK